MQHGYQNKRSREFEHTRLICYTFASAFRDPNTRLPSIYDFMKLPTDEDEVNAMKEDLEAQRKAAVDYINKHYNKNLA